MLLVVLNGSATAKGAASDTSIEILAGELLVAAGSVAAHVASDVGGVQVVDGASARAATEYVEVLAVPLGAKSEEQAKADAARDVELRALLAAQDAERERLAELSEGLDALSARLGVSAAGGGTPLDGSPADSSLGSTGISAGCRAGAGR